VGGEEALDGLENDRIRTVVAEVGGALLTRQLRGGIEEFANEFGISGHGWELQGVPDKA
jgi:hypothetical protein